MLKTRKKYNEVYCHITKTSKLEKMLESMSQSSCFQLCSIIILWHYVKKVHQEVFGLLKITTGF